MSYIDRYTQGSFRGVKFFTESHSTTFGRRVATYELPFDEKGVAHYDLGRAARRFDLTAILLGDDYDKERDALIAALEKRGPGLLVHPQLGRVMVVIRNGVRISESTQRGRVAEVSFSAVEARDPAPPDTNAGSLLGAAKAVKAAAGDSWLEIVTSGPDLINTDAVATMDSMLRDLKNANAMITAVTEAPGLVTDKIDAISRELDNLIQTPRRLFDAIDNAILALVTSAGRVFSTDAAEDLAATLNSSYAQRLTKRIATIGSSAPTIPSADTPARNTQRENRAKAVAGARASSLANTVLYLADAPPASREGALEAADDLANRVLELADSTIEGQDVVYELYDSLKDLASNAVEYLERIAGTRPRTKHLVLNQPVPAQVLAYRLYGDAERAGEIEGRNPWIPNAGAVPAGYEIEVSES